MKKNGQAKRRARNGAVSAKVAAARAKNLKLACRAIESGKLTYGEAAKKYGLPRSTLYNMMSKALLS